MRLDVAGQSYSNRALAAAAQQSLNFFRESIEDSEGSGKSLKILKSAPGYHLLRDITTHPGVVRGMWSGGGRCFVCVGPWVYEIDSTGATVGTPTNLVLNDGLPVQMFGNGNQLGLVGNGFFFINNGTGFNVASFQQSGSVTVAGSTVTWVSGDQFPALFPPEMVIGSRSVLVSTRDTATQITLTAAYPGSGAGVVTVFFTSVNWVSGDQFTAGMEGLPITINGVIYTVKQVASAFRINLADGDNAGQQYNVSYSVYQTNIPYSAASGALVTAVTGAYLDGSFYVQRPSGGTPDLGRTVNFSAVNDGTVWNGIDFFEKESGPDYIQSIFADREQLFVFGTQGSSEVWQNDLNTGRPVRIQGAVAAEGEAARYCTVSMQERLYFLGQSPGGGTVAYRVDGFTPTRVSTHAVEEAWKAKTSTIQTHVVGWWYEEDGHFFWVICFDNGTSWVYDATEKFWHERANWTGSAFGPYRFWYHTFIPEWGTNGRHIVGDHYSGKVLIADATFGDEEGVNMKRVRAMPYLFSAGRRVFCGRVQLTQAAGSTVALEWSEDDAATFSTPENGSGTTATVYWLAQGSFSPSAIPRISVTGQVVATIIDVDAEITYGTT